MADIRITSLTAITTLASTDVLHIGQTAADKKITAPNLKAYVLSGITSTPAQLNILDGCTATTAQLNILDGVTSNATQLNKLDGATCTTAQINKLTGLTVTTAQLNRSSGLVANIQTSLNNKVDNLGLSHFYPMTGYLAFNTGAGTSYTVTNNQILSSVGLGSASYAIKSNGIQTNLVIYSSATRQILVYPQIQMTLSSGKVTQFAISGLEAVTDYILSVTFLLASTGT